MAAGEDDKPVDESESSCEDERPSVCAVLRLTVFIRLKSMVTASSTLAALVIGM